MANETPMTIVGNAVADAEIRYTQSGVPVASFTVASTPRTFDKTANEWRDGEALFMRCSVWREQAENVSETIRKGMRVIVVGNLTQHAYTDKDGNNRTSIDLQVTDVGPALKYATATVQKRAPQGQQGGGYVPPQGQAPQQAAQPPQQAWGPSQPAQQAAPSAWADYGQQGGYNDPPF